MVSVLGTFRLHSFVVSVSGSLIRAVSDCDGRISDLDVFCFWIFEVSVLSLHVLLTSIFDSSYELFQDSDQWSAMEISLGSDWMSIMSH